MLVDSYIDTETIGVEEAYPVPNLTESVSMDKDGVMHITITNLSLEENYEIDGVLIDKDVESVTGEIVVNEMHAMNTFEAPETVRKEVFDQVTITDKGLKFTIPACSVVHLAVK